MKKIYLFGLSALLLSSCVKDLDNVDPKKASKVPAETMFANAQKNLTDQMTSTSVNLNIWRLITQQWQETTYLDESKYDLATRNIPQNLWVIIYRDVLKDLNESKRLIQADNTYTDQGLKDNKLAQIDLMEVYAYSVLVNTFGNIPYSEAMDASKPNPKYDDAKTITMDLLSRIDADLAKLKTTSEGLGDYDAYYGGDAAKWKKFANSLKLKLGMTIVDADGAKAKSVVEAAFADGVFTSNADNAVFNYLDAPPNTNPIWVDVIQSNRNDFVICKTVADQMNALSDPRRPFYFAGNLTVRNWNDTADSVVYKGGAPGASSNYANFSHIADKIVEPSFDASILDYTEVEFYLAEAAQRGWNVTGSAESHYNAAIKASMDSWGVESAVANAYIAQTNVKYDAANWQKSIGTQKWLALYNRGYDAWTEWRRLDFPVFTPATGALSGIPVRYTYPPQEQTLNNANYTEAASAIGGDRVETRLFWDKKDQQ